MTPPSRTIALAGNPNSGKTTLFNALTGLRQKTGNYPGITVEKRLGRIASGGNRQAMIDLIDLPGTYSLISQSPDERVAVDVIKGAMADTPRPDAVIVVVDASNLQRNLYLVSQLLEMQVKLVVALNMTDIAERRGIKVDPDALAAELGVPVVAVVAHKGHGIDRLTVALDRAAIGPEPDWPLPEPMKREIDSLEPLVTDTGATGLKPRALIERLLIDPSLLANYDDPALRDRIRASRETLAGMDLLKTDIEAHYHWIEGVAQRVSSPLVEVMARGKPLADSPGRSRAIEPKPTWSDTLDRVLLNRLLGPVIFVTIMAGLFVSIFLLADPLMGFVEGSIGFAGEMVAGLLPDGVLKDLWLDGIVAGVGGVLVFVPQIAILFALLAILEDSGYLSRAAFIMDRVLSRVGLSGKAFVPMLSGFACAIPAIMATRTMDSARDRLRTIFVLPFMSCGARLPVYALLVGAFFAAAPAWQRGGIVLSLYLLSVVAALATSWVWMKRTRSAATSTFILELPTYKLPQPKAVLRSMLTNTWAFVSKAGTIIFALSVILWAMTYWPRLDESRVVVDASTDQAMVDTTLAAEQLRQSIAGRLGHLIEPAIAPMGFDWKMGVGLVGAFAAREVFVSTMGIVYAAGDAEEDATPLVEAMIADRYADGTAVWTPLVGLTMLIWFVLAMQCMSTVAVVKRETGGWRWPLIQLAYMNALAWVVCVAFYQTGRAIGY
jgi:ferrous iron transport protein B